MNLYKYFESLRQVTGPPEEKDGYLIEVDPTLSKPVCISYILTSVFFLILLIILPINEGVSNWLKYIVLNLSGICIIGFLLYGTYWVGLRWYISKTGVIQEGWGKRKEITWEQVARIKRHPYSLRIHFIDAEGKVIMKIRGNLPGNTLLDPWILEKIAEWSQLPVER